MNPLGFISNISLGWDAVDFFSGASDAKDTASSAFEFTSILRTGVDIVSAVSGASALAAVYNRKGNVASEVSKGTLLRAKA